MNIRSTDKKYAENKEFSGVKENKLLRILPNIKTVVARYCYLLLFFLAPSISGVFAAENSRSIGAEEDLQNQFSAFIAEKRKESDLVALVALVTKGNAQFFSAAVGERKKGSDILVSQNDKWHIGSITKSITATMIARLVEQGELRWDTKIKEVFSDYEKLDDGWGNVSLEQLLTHTSGVKRDFSLYTIFFKEPKKGQSLSDLRRIEILKILKAPPEVKPGTKFIYSNVGYTIAGVIAEIVTGKSWEDLVRSEVFVPLEMTSAGFGHPVDKLKELEQPRGHRRIFGFVKSVTPDSELSSVMAPAGNVHMSLSDLAVFANDHLHGESGQGKLLKAETYRKLHAIKLKNYAYGWVKDTKKEWIDGPIYWHNGSDTSWYAFVAYVPKLDAVIAMATNDWDLPVNDKTAWDIVEYSVRLLKEIEPQ